ncbi:MAG: ADP-ribosylation factor-like protein, partial [Candidatus Hodarchaeota archaeon]
MAVNFMKRYHAYFLGLDYAGKTTMVNRWIRRAYRPPGRPSIRLEAHPLEINGMPFMIYDLPGQKLYQRVLWPSVMGSFTIDIILFYISIWYSFYHLL